MRGRKVCKSCGQPMLRKGQRRQSPWAYRHAKGCPEDKDKSIVVLTKEQLDGAQLGVAVAALRLIAGSDGAECAYPRANAADALREIEKLVR